MLLTKNYNNAFEFVKVIIQNVALYIFDDVTITSALRNHMLIYGEGFLTFLVNGSLRMICTKNYENIFKFIKVTHRIL